MKKNKVALSIAGLTTLAAFTGFELLYRSRNKASVEPLTAERSDWEIISDSPKNRIYQTSLEFKNFSSKYEATVVSVSIEANILYKDEKAEKLSLETKIIPVDTARKDEYITSFLVPAQKSFKVNINAEFSGNIKEIEKIHALVFRLKYTIYDRRGYHENKFTDIIFAPNKEEVKNKFDELKEQGASIFPVKTHLITDSDNMADVINLYAKDFLKEGDIVVIAESPVAITQRRFVHPANLKPGWLARRLCYFVPSAGSLSSPYGMQCAIQEIGGMRVAGAMFAGAVMKLLGKRGWFYTLAGIESELIDDLTGTIPPYDKYIIMGPANPEKYVHELKEKIGADVAIADANDLKRARIIASTLKDAEVKIQNWMLNNPAGNSSEQTPIVIIRPENLNTSKRNENDQTCEV